MTNNIIVPHERSRGPVTAVRRMVVHSSIAELERAGHKQAYLSHVAPEVFEAITQALGPGWLPLETAIAHYRACDELGMSPSELDGLGALSFGRLKSVLLATGASRSSTDVEATLWQGVAALARMGRRIYEGGSAQYTRMGERELRIEHLENRLFAVRYYRLAHLGFLRAAFTEFGVADVEVQLVNPESGGGSLSVIIRWR